MNWFFIALIPPALYAATNLIDVLLLRKIVGRVAIGAMMFFTAVSYGALALIALLVLHGVPPFTVANWWSVAAGVLWAIYLVPYYQAMGKYEPDIAAAYFTLIPALLALFGFLWLGETLSLPALLGVGFVCGGVLGASAPSLRVVLQAPVGLIVRMLLASCAIALGIIAFKLAGSVSYWDNTWYFALAGMVTVLALYVVPQYRAEFVAALRQKPLAFLGANVLNEALDQAAGATIRFAQLLGPVALVGAVNAGIQPFYMLGSWLALTYFGVFVRGEKRGSELRRAFYFCVAALGVALIYLNSSVSGY